MNKNILLALFICANIAYAQTPDSTAVRTGTPVTPTPPVVMSRDGASAEKLNQSSFFGIGAQLGFATGTGITVRYTDPRRYGAEFNFWYITLGKDKAFYDVGAEFQYQFDNSLDSRLYGVGGFGYYANSEGTKDNTLSGPFRIAFGVGYETFISRAAAIDFEGVLTIFSDKTVLPTPQIGICYYFR